MKKPKVELPVYEPPSGGSAFVASYDQATSIEEIEDQMDDWLEDRKQQKKKVGPVFAHVLSLLPRSKG